jgi:hypothetical protein
LLTWQTRSAADEAPVMAIVAMFALRQ